MKAAPNKASTAMCAMRAHVVDAGTLPAIKMKKKIIILFLIANINLYGQDLSNKVGEIEIKLISHNFKRNSDYELTKRKTNRKKRPHLKMYFDSKGKLLKKISFGKQHNSDLRLTDKIETFKYEEDLLVESITYESDYEKIVYPYWKTKFKYDKKGNLKNDSTFNFDNDSLIMNTTFEYDNNSNKTKVIDGPDFYSEFDYNSMGKKKSSRQFFDNELQWEWNFEYVENKRIGELQKYNDGKKDYSRREKLFYKNGNLIEKQDISFSINGRDEKQKYFYNKNGVLSKIEYYQTYGLKGKYRMVSYIIIKVKTKSLINQSIASKINEQIK